MIKAQDAMRLVLDYEKLKKLYNSVSGRIGLDYDIEPELMGKLVQAIEKNVRPIIKAEMDILVEAATAAGIDLG